MRAHEIVTKNILLEFLRRFLNMLVAESFFASLTSSS